MSKKELTFYLSLDVILDTKLAILDSINPQATFEILDNKSYFKRINNNWESLTEGKITNKEFSEKYALRNKETLKKSKLTAISAYLKSLIVEAETADLSDPANGMPVIYLNTWPYKDLDEVDLESLRKAVDYTCGGILTRTEICYFSPEQMPPSFLKERCDFIFMDNFEEWSVMHYDDLTKNRMTNVCVILPKLYLDEPPDEDDLKLDGENPMSPWKMTELLFLEFVKLNMIDVKFFCFIIS